MEKSKEAVLKELLEVKSGIESTRRAVEELGKLVKGYCKPFMNLQECADYIGISRNSLYAKTSHNDIPFMRLGKRLIFETSVIDAWIRSYSVKVKSNDEIAMDVSTSLITESFKGNSSGRYNDA